MNYKEIVELEDDYIEANGQHPLWVYERKIKGKQTISYEDFLQQADYNSINPLETTSVIEISNENKDDCITDPSDEVILTPAIGGFSQKETQPTIQFESFSNIDLSLIKRTSQRLEWHTYQLYKQIRAFSVPQWKGDSKAFLSWLDKESHYSEGKNLIQLNPFEPYGPDNCMLSGDLKELYAPINQKHSTNFPALYDEMGRNGKLCKEWSTIHAFLHWLQHHEYELPDHVVITRIDASKDYSPSNCYFVHETEGIKQEEHHISVDEKIEISCYLGERCAINPDYKYKSLLQKGDIDADVWTFENYLDWVIEKGIHGELAPYFKRVDKSKSYSPDNAYFSWKAEGRTHGMSNTKLYQKYCYFTKHYHEKILPDAQVTFEEFMEIALKEKDYQLNSRIKVHSSSDYISMENIEFIENTNDMDDIIRICNLYQEIPQDQNQFGGLMKFMEWTIRQGYQSWMEFRKIGSDYYSPQTCVWDVFTEAGYIATKGMRALRIYKKNS